MNRTTRCLAQLTDGNDSAVLDTKVSRAAPRTGTIDQASTANQIIQHLTTPLVVRAYQSMPIKDRKAVNEKLGRFEKSTARRIEAHILLLGFFYRLA